MTRILIEEMITLFFIISLISTPAISQVDGNKLSWSYSRKLTVDDFKIKTTLVEKTTSSAQFYLNYQINGFDFIRKNFNKKVNNYMVKDASWIDTLSNVNESLRYQQTLFDISEIYTRRFRRSLRENRKKLIYGTHIAEELSFKIMSDLSKRIIEYNRETKFCADLIKQTEWETKIQREISELNKFAYDK